MSEPTSIYAPSYFLRVAEHHSSSYGPRTFVNAKEADLTVAFAINFNSAGEKLTHKAAGDRYLAVPLTEDPIVSARLLYKTLRNSNARLLNVAGNSIHRLKVHGWNQERVNSHIHQILAKVHEHWPLDQVRSGGQTGVDLAGLVSAYALKIPAFGLFPRGFIQRDENGRDYTNTRQSILDQVQIGANLLMTPLVIPNQENVEIEQNPKALLKAAPFCFHEDGQTPDGAEVFVFGSNLAGRHGRGSAQVAQARFGAVHGKGAGRFGQSYAIPTKDGRQGAASLSDPQSVLSLEVIKSHVDEFLNYAHARPQELFYITRIGCGLAGYKDEQVAPLFADAPTNCLFPAPWKAYLSSGAQPHVSIGQKAPGP